MALSNDDIDIGQLQNDFIRLLLDSGSIDSRGRWTNINRLWHETQHRTKCVSIISSYLKISLKFNPEAVILYLDGVTSFYGVLPLMGEVNTLLDCKLAIWRELGQVVLTEPWLLPSKLSQGLTCIVFQDTVLRGSTLLKAMDDINRVNWTVTDYLCLIRSTEDTEGLEGSLSIFRRSNACSDNFRFHALIDTDQLRSYRQKST